MLKKIAGYLKDEQGVETLEWVAMGAMIVAVGIVVYGPGTSDLPTSRLNGVITDIGQADEPPVENATGSRRRGPCRAPGERTRI